MYLNAKAKSKDFNGIQDSIGLGTRLEKIFYNKKMPAKVKIGISGCNMCCANSYIKDISIVGKRLGWTLVVDGRAGTLPAGGHLLAKDLNDVDLTRIFKKFLDYYAKNANTNVRVFRFVKNVGMNTIKTAVVKS